MGDEEKESKLASSGWTIEHVKALLKLAKNESDPEIARQATEAAQSLLKMPMLDVEHRTAELKQADANVRLTDAKVDQITGGERRAAIEFYVSLTLFFGLVAFAAWGLYANRLTPMNVVEVIAAGSLAPILTKLRSGGSKREP